MSHPAKQQRLEPPEIPETASIPVTLSEIPQLPRLAQQDYNVLRTNYLPQKPVGHTVWFRDCEEVRVVLRKYGLLKAMAKEGKD